MHVGNGAVGLQQRMEIYTYMYIYTYVKLYIYTAVLKNQNKVCVDYSTLSVTYL